MWRLLFLSIPVWLGVCGLAAGVVRTSLHCHVQQTAFLLGAAFLRPYLHYPGGLAEYVALPLTLLGSGDWGGAGLLVGLSACFTCLGAALLRSGHRFRPGALLLLHAPATLILGLMLDCRFPMAILVRLLLAGVAVLLVVPLGRPGARAVGVVLVAPALYYLAGGAAAWVWVAAVWANEAASSPRSRSLAAALLAPVMVAVVIGAGHRWAFLIDWHDAAWLLAPRLPHFLTYRPDPTLYVLCVWLPLVVWIARRSRRAPIEPAGTRSPAGTADRALVSRRRAVGLWLGRLPVRLGLACGYLVLAGATAALVLPHMDSLPRQRAQADLCAARGQWDRVIAQIGRAGVYDQVLNVLWARALVHTDALGRSLFAYPQVLGVDGVFPDRFAAGETALLSSDLYFDLGYVAEAERWACEAQTLQPFAPRVLERLAMTAIIRSDWPLAGMYLRVLARNPWCRAQAATYQAMLADTAMAAADSLVAIKRRQMPTGALIPDQPCQRLQALLTRDPANHLAYEYLATYYLLTHDTAGLIPLLADWQHHGYAQLPELYQQALLAAYFAAAPDATVLARYPLDAAVVQRYMRFIDVLVQHHGNADQARAQLLAGFSGTYWCYTTYLSPRVTGVQLRAREVD
jgi:hypothetical protein